MTHPLTQALHNALDQVSALEDCCETGQAVWNFHTAKQGKEPRADVSVRFSKKPKTSAHQTFAYQHGTTCLTELLHAITAPMEQLPSVVGANFQWNLAVKRNGKVQVLGLYYGSHCIESGGKVKVEKAIARMVDVLQMLPAHQGRTYAIGNQRIPAAGHHEALVLWTAINHAGTVNERTLEATIQDLYRNPLMEVLHTDMALIDAIRTQRYLQV